MTVENVERQPGSIITFDVHVDSEQFERTLNDVYLKNRRDISIPGFRKGKVPRAIFEGMYGKDVFYDEAVDTLAKDAYEYSVEQEEFRVVGQPALDHYEVSDDKELTLKFKITVWPEPKLGQYKGLKAVREQVIVTDERVDEYIEGERKRAGRLETVERPAENGDTLILDYQRFQDGEEVESFEGENERIVLGQEHIYPGLDKYLVGISAGEEKDITIPLAAIDDIYKSSYGDEEDDDSDIMYIQVKDGQLEQVEKSGETPQAAEEEEAGPEQEQSSEEPEKTTTFHVACREVKQLNLPELDDDFVKDVSEYDTMEEYRQSIREELQKSFDAQLDDNFHRLLLIQAMNNMKIDIPQCMVENQIDSILHYQEMNLSLNGITMDDYVRHLGVTKEEYRENFRSRALVEIKESVLFEAIADEEEFDVTEEEEEEEYQKLAENNHMSVDDARANCKEEDVIRQILSQKSMQLIFDTGIAVTPEEQAKTENGGEPAFTEEAESGEQAQSDGDSGPAEEKILEEEPKQEEEWVREEPLSPET